MMDRDDRERGHSDHIGGRGLGLGIGLGIGLTSEFIRRQHEREVATPKLKAKSKDKKRKKKDVAAGKPRKHDSTTVDTDKRPPVEPVIYTPPVFPHLEKLTNCKDCAELWDSLVRYEDIITQDMKKLAERKQQVAGTAAERAKLAASLASATAPHDKAYYATMIKIDDESIAANNKMNADLQKLIDDEQRILAERIAQYQKCFDAYCPKPPVAELPPLPPPSLTPPSPPLLSNPPETPPPPPPTLTTTVDDNRKICGPDITDLVLNVLRDMKKLFDANPDKQTEACRSLLDPRTATQAWDIFELGPVTSPTPGMEYDAGLDQWIDRKSGIKKTPWFTEYSNLCAIPRPVCGATVEFLGTCQHPQVVNYVQWGMMMSLCGGLYPLAGAAAHKVWNAAAYGLTAPSGPQENMVKVGSEYKDELDKDPTNGKGSFVPNITEIKRRLQERDHAISHAEQDCELKCELTDEQRHKLLAHDFYFAWHGLTRDPTGRTNLESVR
jgi:hypothetical protein